MEARPVQRDCRTLYLTAREVCPVYLACPSCPVWAAYLALQVSPAADVLAAVFVPIFAAAARVFVQRAAIAVVVFVQAVAVFVLAAAASCRQSGAAAFVEFEVAADRLAAVFVHSNYSVPTFGVAELVAARFFGVPGPVSGANLEAVDRVFVRVADLRCQYCLAAKRAGGRCSRADCLGSQEHLPACCPGSQERFPGDSNCSDWAPLPELAGLADSYFPAPAGCSERLCLAADCRSADSHCSEDPADWHCPAEYPADCLGRSAADLAAQEGPS